MFTQFEIVSGSIPGRDHVGNAGLLVGRNNQDAAYWRCSERALVAVVCDGCGSARHAEFGAQLGARLVVETMHERQNKARTQTEPKAQAAVLTLNLEQVRQDVLAQLRVLAGKMGTCLSQTVNDFFLFTILGVVMTSERTTVFSIGDGVFAINGDVIRLGPFPGNAPPYLGYALFERPVGHADHTPHFELQCTLPTNNVRSLLLGTDGVLDFVKNVDRQLPGKRKVVGPISQFWQDDLVYKNPDTIRRRLALANSDGFRRDPHDGHAVREPGLLPDDTTLIAVRRRRLLRPATTLNRLVDTGID